MTIMASLLLLLLMFYKQLFGVVIHVPKTFQLFMIVILIITTIICERDVDAFQITIINNSNNNNKNKNQYYYKIPSKHLTTWGNHCDFRLSSSGISCHRFNQFCLGVVKHSRTTSTCTTLKLLPRFVDSSRKYNNRFLLQAVVDDDSSSDTETQADGDNNKNSNNQQQIENTSLEETLPMIGGGGNVDDKKSKKRSSSSSSTGSSNNKNRNTKKKSSSTTFVSKEELQKKKKEEIVKAVGDTFRAKNKQRQQQQKQQQQSSSSSTVQQAKGGVRNELSTTKSSSSTATTTASSFQTSDGTTNKNTVKKTSTIQNQQQQQQDDDENEDPVKESLFDRINPFKAGQKLRSTIDQTLTSIASPRIVVDPKQSIYYLDDRLFDITGRGLGGGVVGTNNKRTSYLEQGGTGNNVQSLWEQDDYIPEVLVVGATGEVGRLVVRRLVLSGRCRVRVLVRDLYTKTLNLLGTGVTYCQGDLNNMDSLQYALTDVDKIIFCAAPPRPDESEFQMKFENYVQENLVLQQQEQSNSYDDNNNNTIQTKMYDDPTTTTSLHHDSRSTSSRNTKNKQEDMEEWERLDAILEVRAKLAEQVDFIGMSNLIRAYQDVRHADYGTSQAAKRTLFKFDKDRPDDFDLFSIHSDDDDDDNDSANNVVEDSTNSGSSKKPGVVKGIGKNMETTRESSYYDEEEEEEDDEDDIYNNSNEDEYQDTYDPYEGYDDEENEYSTSMGMIENRRDASVKTQTQWIRNRFDHGAFVGRIPRTRITGSSSSSTTSTTTTVGEASIISTRLRSRDDPNSGIDLGNGPNSFAGFIVRLCSDGGTYEAFVRTSSYSEFGVEYVCEFSTNTKSSSSYNSNNNNKSKNKFITVRLPFENFKPVRRRRRRQKNIDPSDVEMDGSVVVVEEEESIGAFKGRDVQHLGFRYRAVGSNNDDLPSKLERQLLRASSSRGNNNNNNNDNQDWSSFYLAICYIKLYRSQPEPEIIYLSDARIPPVIKNGMVQHESRQIIVSSSSSSILSDTFMINDSAFQKTTTAATTSQNDAADNNNTNKMKTVAVMGRSPEETYFKYRGEEIVKHSGLSYAIVRVPGYNESPTGETSTIVLSSYPPNYNNGDNDDVELQQQQQSFSSSTSSRFFVSRDEIAQVCVSALLDPNALNKSFYVSKKQKQQQQQQPQRNAEEGDLANQFAALKTDDTSSSNNNNNNNNTPTTAAVRII